MKKGKLRFHTPYPKKGGWTNWQRPVMTNYHLACCDCGLVHTFNFRIGKVIWEKQDKKGVLTKIEIEPKSKYRVEFKVRRNKKYTKEHRG